MARASTAHVQREAVPAGDIAPRPRFGLVWSADNPNADVPAVLERGAPPHMVAFHRGYMCVTAGNFKRALDLFRKAITIKPDFAEAHCNLGATFWRNGQIPEAIAAFREAIKVQPDFGRAHYCLGQALNDNSPEEIAAYREAIRIEPDFAPAYSNLGATLYANGQFAKAIAAFREAVRIKPNFAPAYFDLGTALDASGRPVEAIAAYREATRIAPDFAQAHFNLGVALGDNDPDAIAAYREAVRLKPDWAEAQCNLGAALAADGQIPDAVIAFGKALESASDADKRKAIVGFTLTALNTEVGESNNRNYNPGMATAHDLNALADDLGYTSFEQAKIVLERGAPKTARDDNTARAMEPPRPESSPAPSPEPATARAPSPPLHHQPEPRPDDIETKLEAAKAEAVARGLRTIYHSIDRHRLERQLLPLPENGYANPEDALAAARLANNFGNLQQRLKDAGMEPLPPDDRVRAAQRLSKAYFRAAEAA
jgi:tetratricopeptide (TPR) repeat protein